MSTTLKVYFVESEQLEPTEIRRFIWQLSSNLNELLNKISSVFSNKLVPELTAIHVTEENGDISYIQSDCELKRLFEQAPNQSIVKLWVTRIEQLECDPSQIESDSIDSLFGTEQTDFGSDEEIQSDGLWPQIECDSLQTDVCNMEPTVETGTISMMKSQQKISEGLQRADSDTPDARFNTSYGKSGFASIFSQLAKDIGCWATGPGQNNSVPSDLPPQFVESLCTLKEMGFDVENTNVLKILRKNNGELERTITEVMDSTF